MRGSMVEGKCSSSRADASKEAWMRARSSGVSCARAGFENRRFQSTLCPREEDGKAQLVVVEGPVAVGVVHGFHFDVPRSELGIGNRRHGEAAVADGRHEAVLARLDGVHGHAGESGGYHAIHEI